MHDRACREDLLFFFLIPELKRLMIHYFKAEAILLINVRLFIGV